MQFIRKLSEETEQSSTATTQAEQQQQRLEGRVAQEAMSSSASLTVPKVAETQSSNAWMGEGGASRTDDKAELHERWAHEFKTAQTTGG